MEIVKYLHKDKEVEKLPFIFVYYLNFDQKFLYYICKTNKILYKW